MKKELAILLGAAAVSCSAAIQPAVAFRFDDNHTVERWDALADVFRKNNVRFSLSIIPLFAERNDPAWCKKICQLETEGFEIMDHTPQHTTITVTLAKDDPALAELAKAPFVDHINNGKVCLKYSPGNSQYGEPFKVKIFNKNMISFPTKIKRRMPVEIAGKHYYLKPTKELGVFRMVTIWDENNVNLPDQETTARRCLKERVILADGAYDFLIKTSLDGFRKIGLKKMPKVWIQPGGYYPHLGSDKLIEALRKYNYVSASCQDYSAMKGYADPGFASSAFCMNWGDFNLEKFDLAGAKMRIANTIACRRAAICSSHITPDRRDGKLKEYANMYALLLPWLKANNIKVMTQGELTEHLRTTKVDHNENIMPSLDVDIDNNKRPDGYYMNRSVVWLKNESALQLKGKSALIKINNLCGLPRGKVKFAIETSGNIAGKVQIVLLDTRRKPCGKAVLSIKNSSAEWKKHELELSVPDSCAGLNFALAAKEPNAKIRNPELRSVK